LIRNGPLPTNMFKYLTPYQRDTIRCAIEIYNELPTCICGSKHVMPGNPHLADHELLILFDAATILNEWDVQLHVRRDGKMTLDGIA
jgi:hypothetical protein